MIFIQKPQFAIPSYLTILMILGLLASCGGGSSDGSNPSPNPSPNPNTSLTTINAFVSKAPITGGTCVLKDNNNILATAIPDNGHLIFNNVSLNGLAMIECSDGSYTDETTGVSVDATLLRSAKIINTNSNSAIDFSVTPLTEISVRHAISQGNIVTNITNSNIVIATQFGISGVDITTVEPTDINIQAANNDLAGMYGVVLGAISLASVDTNGDGNTDTVASSVSLENLLSTLLTAVTNDALEANTIFDEALRNVARVGMASANIDTAITHRIDRGLGGADNNNVAIFSIAGVGDSNLIQGHTYTSSMPTVLNADGAVTYGFLDNKSNNFSLVAANTGIVSLSPKTHSSVTTNNIYRYTLVASDTSGATSLLSVRVNILPLAPSLTEISQQNYLYLTPITATIISNLGGTISRCYINPSLPAGLNLTTTSNGNGCVISGTPTAATPITNYNITATNAAGSSTVSLSITITKANQASFSLGSNKSVNFGSSNFIQAATGALGNGATTYTSNNTEIATVNSRTGEVSIISSGSVVITATNAGDSNYNAASDNYTLTIGIADNTPNGFSFTPQIGLALNTNAISNVITVSGLNTIATISISGSGGTYRINGSNATSAIGTVSNGDTVQVNLISSNSHSTSRAASLSIGTVSAVFNVVTQALTTPQVSAPIPLFGTATLLEPALQEETSAALITRFSDRARDRHAREDQFHIYDHYLSFYWEDRTAAIEIVDTVGKGGNDITFNVTTQHRLSPTEAELRFFYRGINTVAEYHNNGIMRNVGGLNYTRNVAFNSKTNSALSVGDRLEFELSQFLQGTPNGRDNYYGTTFLYIVGQGIVPWEARGVFQDFSTELEDSYPIPERGWLGGKTTLPYQYSNEPTDHFQQMATNLSNINGQTFVLGRRIHHTDFETGAHDEAVENAPFTELANLIGPNYINQSCIACHAKNGRALPPAINQTLEKYVVKVGDFQGNPHPQLGTTLQPDTTVGAVEGGVVIGSWSESNGLRTPNFVFSGVEPTNYSARIAPQLVGMGLLEAIKETDIQALADPDDVDNDGISGKMHLVADPKTQQTRLGRFGWKATGVSIEHQVATALNIDIGVMTSILPNPDCGQSQTNCGSSGAEISDKHLSDLSAYVALLGIRARRSLNDTNALAGETLFTQIGCVSCHVDTFQTSAYHPHAELRDQTIHPYTDLLLHDMGQGLASTLIEGNAMQTEWRTPPLWGIGLTAGVSTGEAYLHDGRARNLTEAILWHGGEAQTAKQRFSNLDRTEQSDLITFLKTL